MTFLFISALPYLSIQGVACESLLAGHPWFIRMLRFVDGDAIVVVESEEVLTKMFEKSERLI